MTGVRVVGVDPGPIPGIVVLETTGGAVTRVSALQCTADVAPLLVATLLDQPGADRVLLAVEKFVVGRASMRSAGAGAVTRDLVGQLQAVAEDSRRMTDVIYTENTASTVKSWAIEMRLAHAGLLEPTKAMRHARDAARHALFAAVRHGGLPDPLSNRDHRSA